MGQASLPARSAQAGMPAPHTLNMALQLLDADVAETVKLSFFSVMLKTDVTTGIQLIVEVGAEYTVDPDANACAFGLDPVMIPIVAFERAFGSGTEFIGGRGVVGF